MKQSIKLRIDDTAYGALEHPIGIFLRAWIWDACGDGVLMKNTHAVITNSEFITLTFDNPEDALFLKLQGIPNSLKDIVKIVK